MPAIKKPFEYFNVVTYTGNGTARTISGVGFQPDFVWIKVRNTAGTHVLTDSVRGGNKQLFSNLTNAEGTATNKVTGFTSDGFTLGADDGSGTGDANYNGNTYVAWCWKANGTGVTNTAGSITSTVSANTTSGFSVITYTGNGSAGATVGHGLGVAPRMLIIKARNGAGYSWKVYHASLGSAYHLELESSGGTQSGIWNSTNPSSTVFTLGTNAGVNENGKNYVCYAFADVTGYSKLGSYTGNGSSDGTFVYLGFRPKYVMIRRADATGNWWNIKDTARDPYNTATHALNANLSDSEYNPVDDNDFVSNGFKIRAVSTVNNNNGTLYIYMAFAENPFKYSLAR